MKNSQMMIGDFAKACGLTKAALMHYEEIGLFAPEYVSVENGYRYYGEDQIFRIEAISQLRSMDMSLSEIKAFLDHNSRSENLEILKKNLHKIEKKLFRLEQIERLLHTTIASMESEPSITIGLPFLEYLPEPTYLYIFKTSQRDGTIVEHLPVLRSYMQKCREMYVNSNYSIGEIILHRDIVNNSFRKTYGCYRLEHRVDGLDCYEKPAGLYLSMYYRGHSNDLPVAYRKLKKYAREQNYLIINDAYEEDISTVISENDRSHFILKVSFQIQEPSGS